MKWMEVYIYTFLARSIFSYFAAFVVQQIQQRPKPTAGFSYGSLATGIWRTFLLGDKGASESFVSQLLEMVLQPDEALLWLIFLLPSSCPLSHPFLLCNKHNFSLLIMSFHLGPSHNWEERSRNTIIPARRRESSQGRRCLCWWACTL